MGRRWRLRPMHYWALFGNPRFYRVEEAVQELEVDTWTTKGKAIRAGDRVAIGKGAGRDGRRGVIALGEVISEPRLISDAANPYWTRDQGRDAAEERVEIRYVRPPRLPLWLND